MRSWSIVKVWCVFSPDYLSLLKFLTEVNVVVVLSLVVVDLQIMLNESFTRSPSCIYTLVHLKSGRYVESFSVVNNQASFRFLGLILLTTLNV